MRDTANKRKGKWVKETKYEWGREEREVWEGKLRGIANREYFIRIGNEKGAPSKGKENKK